MTLFAPASDVEDAQLVVSWSGSCARPTRARSARHASCVIPRAARMGEVHGCMATSDAGNRQCGGARFDARCESKATWSSISSSTWLQAMTESGM
jgi:hypothetical protein